MERLSCALGIDSGYTNTGVAVVNTNDFVLMTKVITPPKAASIEAKVGSIIEYLRALIVQYEPVVIGLETYTAPSFRTRAMSAKDVAWHNWLIGACLMLPALAVSPAPVHLLEAKYWQHTLTGIPSNQAIGGKETIERTVEMRTGHVFQRNSGGHCSDACGIALVALDAWQEAHLEVG